MLLCSLCLYIGCNNGTNRLIDGISDTYDEVQECVAGEWFPVCAEFWDSRDGNVVCGHSQQNTSNSVRDTAIVTSFGTINDTSFVRRQCEGTEGRLNECQQLSSDPVCNAGSAYVLCHDLPGTYVVIHSNDMVLQCECIVSIIYCLCALYEEHAQCQYLVYDSLHYCSM